MKWKLGIDTGGSYTDAVLVDCNTGEVIKKAKAATTKEDLNVGIELAINQLEIDQVKNICLVCLSTTLATNAVIEEKGAAVGLITIDEPDRYAYPAAFRFNIKGKINVKGYEISPLDLESAKQCLAFMKGKVEALAVSGYASVRNPSYERQIKELSDEILGVPVVCAHELTNVLGYYERTVTATLNARLIPVIKELIAATKGVLKRKGINATLVIIKGDGNCMVDSFAEERPIETVLSGPAASALGGMILSNEDSMIVADMGGTTLDIVPVLNREIPVKTCGAVVGSWKTRVKAMNTRSFGLGGDSYIRMDHTGGLNFGPERAVPLCMEAERNQALVEEMKNMRLCSNYHIVGRQEMDCIALFKTDNINDQLLEPEEKEILQLLKDGSHSLLYLSEKLGRDIDSIKIKRLLELNIVQLISLTPTDILHATGEYTQYNREISRIAVNRMANRSRMSESEFMEYAENAFTDRICSALIESLLAEQGLDESYISDEMMRCVFDHRQPNRLADFNLKFNVPIVGIGAPAKIWFGKVAEKLRCQVIVPKNSEVANAVGTVSGNINEALEALIRYDSHIRKYIAHLPRRRVVFETLDEAVSFTEKELLLCGKDFAEKLGVKKYRTCIFKDKTETQGDSSVQNHFVELKIKVAISADTKNMSC